MSYFNPLPPLKRPRARKGVPRPPDGLWTVPEALAFLMISERHLRDLIKEKRIPVVHLGASVRFRPEDLREFVRPK